MSGILPLNNRRRIIKSIPNPIDKSTVVSIYPKEIIEYKCTIQPGTFKIPAGSYERPSLLVVGPSSWWREIDEEQPYLEIPVSSVQVADSIVKDYSNGLLACDMSTAMPGLFFLMGAHTLIDVLKDHKEKLDAAKAKQRNWYEKLVKMADILWSRTNGNPLSISDDARFAAKELNLHDKEWQKDAHKLTLVKCIACGTLVNDNIVICPNCKVVMKPEEFKKMNLQFATQ